MGKNTNSPYSNPDFIPEPVISGKKRVGFKRGAAPFSINDPEQSVVPGSELYLYACALVEVILEMRNDLDQLFSKIVSQLSLPDIWQYIQKNIPFADPFTIFI